MPEEPIPPRAPDGGAPVTPQPHARTARLRRLLRLAAVDVAPLRRHRDFRLIFIGQFVSFFGSMITYVALPYQVYALTHSSLAVGAMGAVQFVPLLLLAFVGGALADSFNRRWLVLITELGMEGSSALLALIALLPHPQLWMLYVIGALAASLDSLQRPSLNALIPRLVDVDELTAASALSGLRSNTAMILGPALAGLLIASLGLTSTYLVDVATFAVSLVTLALMRATPPPPDAERPSLRRVVEGLRYAGSRQELLGTYVVDMVAIFFGMPNALFPALAVQYAHGGGQAAVARALGLLFAAPGVGAFLASATSGWAQRVHRRGRAVILAAGGWGLAITGLGLVADLRLACVFLALAGGADMISGLFRSVIWNETIPDALRGRLASIEMLSYLSGPLLGDFESGAVATAFTPRISVLSGGVICMLGVGVVALALPRFRRYDNRHVPAVEAAPAAAR
ncbi:MAG TPA: MFS transporter [Ktedonobacterales bacterium]|nr:MFS transporter [Ktedonobacterales bacterium]